MSEYMHTCMSHSHVFGDVHACMPGRSPSCFGLVQGTLLPALVQHDVFTFEHVHRDGCPLAMLATSQGLGRAADLEV